MRLRALGSSGSGMPRQNLSSYLLDGDILFDAGGLAGALDVKGQLRISHIFVSHPHLDHILGIPFLADNIYLAGGGGVEVLSLPSILGKLKSHIFNGVIWPDFTTLPLKNAGRPVIRLTGLKEGEPFITGQYEITAFRMRHTTPSAGYLARHRQTGRNFFYTGDTGPGSPAWKKLFLFLAGAPLDCLIAEVSFPNRMEKEAIRTGHLTAGLLAGELKGFSGPQPGRIFVTHPKNAFRGEIARETARLGMPLLADGQKIGF